MDTIVAPQMPSLRLPSTPEARAPVIAAVLSTIKESDPGFDESSLLRGLPGRYLALRRTAGELSVEEVRLVWAERVLWEDRLTVAIDSLTTSGEEVTALTEYWTLARRRGLQSATGPAKAECPACGAPIELETDVCRYCQAELPGPLQGWLVDRVDHDVDWYEGPAGFIV